ncbi:MAG TPA: histidine triad nucleotide-binding protein [Alphaproteobacteria bacterium]|nr:histidine triad nucleotide-binding protein [Alphaproteobacteria bacterium]
MAYDRSNVFARILRGEIPCKKVYENDHALAFHDINPLMPVHVLVIPKGEYTSLDDFSSKASVEALGGFLRAVGETARIVGVNESGYRLVANNGRDANQEIPHFHVHIFGGRPIRGRMVRPDDPARE